MENLQFISNGPVRSFYNELVENLNSCTQFKISVAFITYGGLQVLLETFKSLEERNVHGEILTTTYQNMTTPKVLERLSKFKNIQLKIFVPPTQTDGFHAKGYLFHKDAQDSEKWTVIIGSSNITGRALKQMSNGMSFKTKIVMPFRSPGILRNQF